MEIEENTLRTVVREEMKSVLKEIGLHDDNAGEDVRDGETGADIGDDVGGDREASDACYGGPPDRTPLVGARLAANDSTYECRSPRERPAVEVRGIHE